jgi:nicotinamidase/pyrazinamidase
VKGFCLDNKAVIIIDMPNDFVTGDLKCERAQHMIPNLTRLIQAARKYKIPVVYSNDAHYERERARCMKERA